MVAKDTQATATSDREIVLTRDFAAPRALVWKVWTNPDHIAQWWGPNGFTTTTHEMDVRPGGVWRFIMHGPDGVDYPNKIVYSEVVEPERLVYDHGGDEEDTSNDFQVTVTFTEEDGKTRITMRSLFASAEARDYVVREFGAIEGGNQTLNRLGEYLTQRVEQQLVITRLFDAPRELVWQAWTEAEHVAQWWRPRVFTIPDCEIDLRPGGALRLVMRGPDGAEYPTQAVYHEIVPLEKLVFTTSALADEAGDPQLEVLNTVTFAEEDGRTRLTLQAIVLKAGAAAAAALAGMQEGWSQSLDNLAELLAA